MSFSFVGVLAFAGAAASSPLVLSRPGFLPVQKHGDSSISVLPFQTPSASGSAPRLKVTIHPSSKTTDVPTWWPVGSDVKVAVTPVASSSTTTTLGTTTFSTSVVDSSAFVSSAATTSPASSAKTSTLVLDLTSATSAPAVVASPLSTNPATVIIAQPSTKFTIAAVESSTPAVSSSAKVTTSAIPSTTAMPVSSTSSASDISSTSSASAISSSVAHLRITSSSSSDLGTPAVTSAVVTTTSDPLSTFSSFKVSFLATSSSFDPTTTTTLSTTRTTTTTTTPTVSITYTATAPSDPAATAALLFSELTEEVKTLKKWFQGIERDVEIIYQNGVQDDEIIFRHEREIDTLAANLTETVKYVNTFTSMYNDMTHESEDDFKGLYSGVQNVSQRLDVLEFQTNNDLTHFYWTLHSKMERRFAALEVENIELKEKLDEQLCRQPVSTDAVEERLGAIEVENAELKEKLDKLLGQQVVPHGIVEEIPQPVEEHHEEHAEEEAPKEPQPEEQHWPEWFEGEWNGKN